MNNKKKMYTLLVIMIIVFIMTGCKKKNKIFDSVIKADTESGYAFNVTLDEFLNKYNNSNIGVTEGTIKKEYWKGRKVEKDSEGKEYQMINKTRVMRYIYGNGSNGIVIQITEDKGTKKIICIEVDISSDYFDKDLEELTYDIISCATDIKREKIKKYFNKVSKDFYYPSKTGLTFMKYIDDKYNHVYAIQSSDKKFFENYVDLDCEDKENADYLKQMLMNLIRDYEMEYAVLMPEKSVIIINWGVNGAELECSTDVSGFQNYINDVIVDEEKYVSKANGEYANAYITGSLKTGYSINVTVGTSLSSIGGKDYCGLYTNFYEEPNDDEIYSCVIDDSEYGKIFKLKDTQMITSYNESIPLDDIEYDYFGKAIENFPEMIVDENENVYTFNILGEEESTYIYANQNNCLNPFYLYINTYDTLNKVGFIQLNYCKEYEYLTGNILSALLGNVIPPEKIKDMINESKSGGNYKQCIESESDFICKNGIKICAFMPIEDSEYVFLIMKPDGFDSKLKNEKIESNTMQNNNQIDYEEYCGKYFNIECTDGTPDNAGGYVLNINSINNNRINFSLESYQMYPSSRIASIYNIDATLNGNIAKFDFTDDGWGNSGEGTIELLNDNRIYVKTKITSMDEYADWNVNTDNYFKKVSD